MSGTNGNGKVQVRNDAALGDVFSAVAYDRATPRQNSNTGYGFNFRLGKVACEELYRIPICRRVCRAKADAAILKGWEVTLGGKTAQKVISAYNAESERLKIAQRFNEAQVLANIYGGAIIVLNIDDGQHWSKPLDEKKIKGTRSLRVFDRYKVSPVLDGNVFNPSEPEYYQFMLGTKFKEQLGIDSKVDISIKDRDDYIHASRCIRFDGITLPPDMMANEGGWGMSLLDSIWEDFCDWKSSLKSMKSMLEGFSVFTYKISKLGDLIDEFGEDALKVRFQTFKRGIEALGAAAIDKENEDISYTARQMNGVDSVADKLRDAFIGATGLPHTKLFGESPSGLGASGESEEKDWSASVSAFQQADWHPKLRPLIRLIFLGKDGPSKGKEPEDWGIKFHSLIQESPSEIAQLRSTNAQTDNTYVSMGALLVDEVRKRFEGSEYRNEIVLDPEAWAKSKEEQSADAFGGDFGGETDPNALSPEDPTASLPEGEDAIASTIASTNEEPVLDSLRFDAVAYADLEKKDGQVKYLDRWWKVNEPIKSDRADKKMMVLAKKGGEVKLIHFGDPDYEHNYSKSAKRDYLTRSAGIRDKDGNLTKDDPFSPNYWSRKVLWPRNKPADGTAKRDSAPPVKRILKWNGLQIGVTHDPGDTRFQFGLPMVAHYGHLRGSYGHAEDGLAHDFYLQPNINLEDAQLFKIRQNHPDTGFKDEDKYCLAQSADVARSLYQYHAGRDRFGGIDPADVSELDAYRQVVHQDSCDCEVCQIKKKYVKKQIKKKVKSTESRESPPSV